MFSRDHLVSSTKKATSDDLASPKRKHVRTLIVDSYERSDAAEVIFEQLSARPLVKGNVCTKALAVVHSLFLEGHHRLLEHHSKEFFDDCETIWNHSSDETFGVLCLIYSRFLHIKVKFHGEFPFFYGCWGVEELTQKGYDVDVERAVGVITSLLSLQEKILGIYEVVYPKVDAGQYPECKVAPLLPLVKDSFVIYSLLVHFLGDIHQRFDSVSVLSALTERFYDQYMTLKSFYLVAQSTAISDVIAVPSLPKDPPKFARRNTKPPPTRHAPPVPTPPPPVVSPVLLDDSPPRAAAGAPVAASAPAPAPAAAAPAGLSSSVDLLEVADSRALRRHSSDGVVGWGASPIWTTDDYSGFASAFPQSTSPPPPVVATTSPQEPKPKSAFESLSAEVDNLKKTDFSQARHNREAKERRAKEEEEARRRQAEEEHRKKKAEAMPAKANDDAQRRLAAAEKEVAELRRRLKNGFGQYKALERKHNSLRDVSAGRVADLERLRREREQDARSFKGQEVRTVRGLVERSLSRLDDPSNMGYTHATLHDVYAIAKRLQDSMARSGLLSPDSSPEAVTAAVFGVNTSAELLLQTAKGAANHVDPETRGPLLEATRGAIMHVLATLDYTAQSAEAGTPVSADDKAFAATANDLSALCKLVSDEARRVERLAEEAEAAAEAATEAAAEAAEAEAEATVAVEPAPAPEEGGESALFELGVQIGDELAGTIEVIEAAKKALEELREQCENESASAVFGEAGDMTAAIGELVRRATALQHELIEEGKALPLGERRAVYRDAQVWSEGLISASKSVASETSQLAAVAGEVSKDRPVDALVVQSKAVVQAICLLLTASRVKANPNSANQQQLEVSAKSVKSHATQLVARAKEMAVSATPEDPGTPLPATRTKRKIKEMELQMAVLRLEKELDDTRKKLMRLRQADYREDDASVASEGGIFER